MKVIKEVVDVVESVTPVKEFKEEVKQAKQAAKQNKEEVREVTEAGIVQIADDVIAVIAEIAALEVEGVKSIGYTKPDLMHTLTGKKAAKGIRVDIGDMEGEVSVFITGVVSYGAKIKNVCLDVQEKVKTSIETMTGLRVTSVDVHIVGVAFENDEIPPIG